ncbi:peptidoglycan DD-metalloendopeptidase family protein [Virgibacillus kimchii]
MKEENNGASKNKWRRIFRKKWFFPALYLTIAAVLLTTVIWYQNLDNQIPEVEQDGQEVETDDFTPTPNEEEAQPVVDQQEIIQMPVSDQEQAEIVTKFYDYNADQEDQESALVLYNNRYYQSTGVGIATPEGETFDVIAALSGTVTEVKEDPLLGNVVIMSHEDEVMTYYAALEDVQVSAGDTVNQGEQIASAGNNLFGKDDGTHVYFELRKDGEEVNPEEFFGQPVSSLSSLTEEATEETESTGEAENSGMPEDDATEDEQTGTSPSEDEDGEPEDEVTDPIQDPVEDEITDPSEEETDTENE